MISRDFVLIELLVGRVFPGVPGQHGDTEGPFAGALRTRKVLDDWCKWREADDPEHGLCEAEFPVRRVRRAERDARHIVCFRGVV